MIVRGERESQVAAFASQMGTLFQSHIDHQKLDLALLGPCEAPINKLRGKYRFHMFLNGSNGELLRSTIRKITSELKTPDEIQWIVDIDPLEMI